MTKSGVKVEKINTIWRESHMARYKIETNDRHEHMLALHGTDLIAALWDLDQWLRSQLKYNPDGLNGDKLDILEIAREQLHDLMNHHGIDFDLFQ
jgi:hypothetical protein